MSFEDLRNHNKIISSNEDYEFLNSTILPKSLISDSILLTKISCFSTPHSKELRNYINNIPDSIVPRAERIRMKNSLSKEPCLWDNKRLNNCWLIIPKDYKRMAQSDTTDYWEEFRKVFGVNGKHNFSKPIFNSSKNILVIEHLISRDWFWSENEILLYKKENNIWKLVDKKSLWMS